MSYKISKVIFLLSFILLLPAAALASIGVGIGTGKIVVDKPLKPGIIYNLPSITVLNTGDEPGDYGFSIEYHQDQPQLLPDKTWFNFSPASFRLEPGKTQTVAIILSLPIKTVPGDYFA